MRRFLAPFIIVILIFSLFLAKTTPTYASCQVGGTILNTIEALNAQLSENLVSDCVKNIVHPDNPASMEKTTIGEIDPDNPKAGLLDYSTQAVIYVLNTKPVSSKEYIADLMDNIGIPIAQPAYAQTGIGFNALQPILPLWKAFRNVAFFLYIIIFVVVGFMIMFRTKIDPQTVVSIQAALPRLVITLILITFSYAIAGFMVDLIYVGIYLAVYIFYGAGILLNTQDALTRLLNDNLYMIMFRGKNFMVTAPADAIGVVIEQLVGGALGDTVGWAAEAVAKLVIGIALTVALFKLFITLGIGFVKIIISVIFAPLHIMMNAFPGSNAFMNWLKGLLANIAMFPAVAIFFIIGAALMGATDDDGYENPFGVNPETVGYYATKSDDLANQWTPPFLIGRQDPLIKTNEGGYMSPIKVIIGLMIILMSPQVAQMTRDALKVEQAKYGSAIGETMGTATGMATAPIRHLRAQSAAQKQNRALGESIAQNITRTGRTGPT
jgi:hypothetical protein